MRGRRQRRQPFAARNHIRAVPGRAQQHCFGCTHHCQRMHATTIITCDCKSCVCACVSALSARPTLSVGQPTEFIAPREHGPNVARVRLWRFARLSIGHRCAAAGLYDWVSGGGLVIAHRQFYSIHIKYTPVIWYAAGFSD